MKRLSGRMHDIASGQSGLTIDLVNDYRNTFASLGYELPKLRFNGPSLKSTFGTLLRAAVEKEIGRPLSCGDCIGYLRSLNQQAEHDTAEITQYLYANFQWPSSWREKIGDKHKQKKRITEIVESTVIVASQSQ